MAAQSENPRDPRRITQSLPSLLRASVAMIAEAWGDQSDTARLHDDPVLAIAANDRVGVGATEDVLVSQTTPHLRWASGRVERIVLFAACQGPVACQSPLFRVKGATR